MSGEFKNSRVEVVGHVVSDRMSKTISVEIFRMVKHKKYGKFQKKTSFLKAHDEAEVAKIGDKVRVVETRPLSKTKRWKLVEVIETSKISG